MGYEPQYLRYVQPYLQRWAVRRMLSPLYTWRLWFVGAFCTAFPWDSAWGLQRRWRTFRCRNAVLFATDLVQWQYRCYEPSWYPVWNIILLSDQFSWCTCICMPKSPDRTKRTAFYKSWCGTCRKFWLWAWSSSSFRWGKGTSKRADQRVPRLLWLDARGRLLPSYRAW